MSSADGLRLTILGGFLGSGKTTWLRHVLRDAAGVHVIVNEAAGAPVDDVLLATVAPVSVLAGGCCCCERRDALVVLLRALAERRHAGEDGLRRVVLETSGLADPAAIAAAVAADPVLAANVRIEEIVVALDAQAGAGAVAGEPLAAAQVAAADRVVLTKADVAGPEALARAAGVAAVLAPRAVVEAAAAGAPVPVPPAVPPPEAFAAAAGGDAPAPVAVTLEPGPGADWPALVVWLSALLHHHGDRILRCKGLIGTPAGQVVLQAVGPAVQRPELTAGAEGREGLVLIGRGLDAALLERSLRAFTA